MSPVVGKCCGQAFDKRLVCVRNHRSPKSKPGESLCRNERARQAFSPVYREPFLLLRAGSFLRAHLINGTLLGRTDCASPKTVHATAKRADSSLRFMRWLREIKAWPMREQPPR